MKKYRGYILAFIIPITIMLIAMAVNHFYPFGQKILLMLDGLHQYPGFVSSIKDVIQNQESIFYSFKGFLGFNYFAVNTYYVFNFTNILVLFFSKINIIDFYSTIIVLKLGLCSLSMAFLINYLYPNKLKTTIIFSTAYGLMVYNLLYYLNYMWFDSIILLPIVIMGIEKIFKKNKFLLYIIALSLSIIANYYIGFMICIFSLIFFIYKLLQVNKKKQLIVIFLFASLISIALASFVLIPSALELMNGKSSLFANYIDNYFKFDLDFFSTFYKLTFGSFLNGDLEFGTPNIYVSLFVYINAALYFINKKINKKEKLLSGLVILFFLISMSFNLLDYFWHLMQMPIWYPTRYSFLFSFFLIYLGIKNFISYEKKPLKSIIIFALVLIILIIIGSFTADAWHDTINIKAKLIYLLISFVFIGYYLYFLNNDYFKKFIIYIFIFEICLNTITTLKNNGNTNTVSEFNNTLKENVNAVSAIQDSSFYRLTVEDKTITNNGLLVGYNDINLFSSVRNKKTVNILENYFKLHAKDNCNVTYNYNNPIVNAIFSLKYFVSIKEIDYYKLYETDNNYFIYENQDATSIGFLTNEKVLDLTYNNNLSDNINSLNKSITETNDNIMNEILVSEKNANCTNNTCIYVDDGEGVFLKYNFKINEDGFIFGENNFAYKSEKTIYEIIINNKLISNSIASPIYVKNGDVINFNIYPDAFDFRDYDYHVYFIKMSEYQKFVSNILVEKAEMIEYKSASNFKIKVEVKDNNILFTSIPNDNGWQILVDGQKYKITEILNGLIGLNLKPGPHIISFNYFPPGLLLGLIISGSSSLGVALWIICKKHHRNKS